MFAAFGRATTLSSAGCPTASGPYTLWLYYHRLTPDTLYTALTRYVEPKMQRNRRYRYDSYLSLLDPPDKTPEGGADRSTSDASSSGTTRTAS